MTLQKGFLFSQSSLQDYVDCQRRFQLRYLHHLSWPAVEAEPVVDYEQTLDQGSQFHKIVHQYLLGVPESRIERSLVNDELMESWWRNYLHSVNSGILQLIENGKHHFEEITLSAPLGDVRLAAKYDFLISTSDGQWIILDWKTSRNHPKRKWLADRLQTHVYPFVLAMVGSGIFGGDQVVPDKIEMIYWFTNQPEQPERFAYNQSAYEADARYIHSLVSAICQKTEKIFPLTPDVKRCLFCTYRSLCNRGVKAGELQHLEEWDDQEPSSKEVAIDYDQIGEIEF